MKVRFNDTEAQRRLGLLIQAMKLRPEEVPKPFGSVWFFTLLLGFLLAFVGLVPEMVEAQTANDPDGWAFFVDLSRYEGAGLPNLPDQTEALARFRDALRLGGYEASHLIDVVQKDFSGIKKAFGELNGKLTEKSHLLLYFRGYLAQTTNPNAFYLLPQDALLGNLNTYISPANLEDWLKSIRTKLQGDQMVLILDGYLQTGIALPQTNPFNYLGIPTLWLTQPAPTPPNVPQSSFLDGLAGALRDSKTDLNGDRAITNQEVHNALVGRLPSIRHTGANGLYLKLPSLIEIRSDLTDAEFYIDGDKGMRKEVQGGEHRMRILKSGYRPYEKGVSVSGSRGESKIESVAATDLTAIHVYGTVSDSTEKPKPNATVKIVEFPLVQLVTDDTGRFRFVGLASVLTVGKTYRLEAEGTDSYRGSTSFMYEGNTDLRYDLTLTLQLTTPEKGEAHPSQVEKPPTASSHRRRWVIGFALLGVIAVVGGYLLIRQRGQFKDIPNPYVVGKPVSTKEMFFGRSDLFEFIRSRFSGSSQAITIVLYGGRRTGKTSVLYQILNGALGPKFIPVFIDLQEMAGVNTSGLLRMIAQKTHSAIVAAKSVENQSEFQTALESIEQKFDQPDNKPFQLFNDFLSAISPQIDGQSLIFLIDEYEILQTKIESRDLSEEIFSYLRHLMQNRENLAFIFSGSREFERMENRQWALMFNAAIPKKVSFLNREEAVRLITEPVKGFARYTPSAVEKLLRITAGQPYFTQVVCQGVVEYLNEVRQKKITPEIVEKVSTEIVVANTPYHFAYIWSESSRAEKCVLSALAALLAEEMAGATPEEIGAKLAEHSLNLPVSEIRKTLATLMEKDLIEQGPQPDAYRYRMDLTRFWMQSEHSIWSLLNELSNT